MDFTTNRSEEDQELVNVLDAVLYSCVFKCGENDKGRLDMHGEATYDDFGGKSLRTGTICRSCWENLLENWLKANRKSE